MRTLEDPDSILRHLCSRLYLGPAVPTSCQNEPQGTNVCSPNARAMFHSKMSEQECRTMTWGPDRRFHTLAWTSKVLQPCFLARKINSGPCATGTRSKARLLLCDSNREYWSGRTCILRAGLAGKSEYQKGSRALRCLGTLN